MRADNGTENTYVAGLQRFFRHNSTDSFAGDKSFMYGRSVSNQRIEAWWSQLRRGCTKWWMGHFKELRENGLYCDLNPVQVEQGSTAITTFKHMGQPWAHAGTAPSYANIFMADLENKLLDNSPNNLQLLIWKRYIDDIFVVWTHGEESLHTFMNHLNTSQPTIKFEHEYSHSNLHLLDTTVTLTQQGTLVTSLYTKPTDRTLLLHNKSHHPAIHLKQGVIYSQALRYRRITTHDGEFLNKLDRLRTTLLTRGYKDREIIKQCNRVMDPTQADILRTQAIKSNTTPKNLPFVIEYHTDLPHISNILKSKHTLAQD